MGALNVLKIAHIERAKRANPAKFQLRVREAVFGACGPIQQKRSTPALSTHEPCPLYNRLKVGCTLPSWNEREIGGAQQISDDAWIRVHPWRSVYEDHIERFLVSYSCKGVDALWQGDLKVLDFRRLLRTSAKPGRQRALDIKVDCCHAQPIVNSAHCQISSCGGLAAPALSGRNQHHFRSAGSHTDDHSFATVQWRSNLSNHAPTLAGERERVKGSTC